MNTIDLNCCDVYIRDEFDHSVLKFGINSPTSRMIIDTLISGGSNNGRNARMFLKAEDMYRMLFSHDSNRIKKENNNHLILIKDKPFKNALFEVGDKLKELGYSINIPFGEYFPILDLYPSSFIIVKTREFMLSYSQCRPCIAEQGNELVYIQHLKNTIIVPGISDEKEYITPKTVHEFCFTGNPNYMHIFEKTYCNILNIDKYDPITKFSLEFLISYFLQSVLIEYQRLLILVSKDIYNVSLKSNKEKYIEIAIRTRGEKYDENIKILQEWLNKINTFENILNKPKTFYLFEEYSFLIYEKDINKYKINIGTPYLYNITHPKLL